MASNFRLFTIALLATSGFAMTIGRSDTAHPGCVNPKVAASASLAVGTSAINIEAISCGIQPKEDITICLPPLLPCPPPTTTTVTASPSPSSTPKNVCGDQCITSCGSIGDLPPISEDCQTIVDSITILSSSTASTFDVPSNTIKQLTFGTCRFWFENFSGSTLTYCWDALASTASAAGTMCFPPTQPVRSAAFCNGGDGSWQVGAGHS